MNLECYRQAGKIASEVRENARKTYHVGSTLLEVCESIEEKIKLRNASPAFPVNVSLNEIAAHYTAEPQDETTVKEGDVLKIDIGVHVDGYVADTAVTVCYNAKYDSLVKAAEYALAEAVKFSRANVQAGEIGKLIENAISKFGCKPIQNLSGHSLEQYTIHAGKSIPNVKAFGSTFALVPNRAYAVEPFVTTKEGLGIVYEGKIKNIFGITSRKPVKESVDAGKFLDEIWERYKTLPFALRWMTDKYDVTEARGLLGLLVKRRNIHAYPILVEGHGKIVAQAEHTFVPTESSVEVITG